MLILHFYLQELRFVGIMDNKLDHQIVAKHIIERPSEEAARRKSIARFANPDDKADLINTVAVRPTLWAIVEETRKPDPKRFIVSAEQTDLFEVRRRKGDDSADATVTSVGKEFLVFRKRSFHFDSEHNGLVNSILVRAKAKMQAQRAVCRAAPPLRQAMGPMRPAMMSLRPAMGSLARPAVAVPAKDKTISWAAMAAKAC